MKKRIALFIISTLFVCAGLFAKGDSYIYDYWGEIEKSPDMYRVSSVKYASDLGLDVSLKNPSGLFCYKNEVYILDTDNNRIIQLEYTADKTLEFVRVIDRFNANGATDAEGNPLVETFNSPKDLYINPEDETVFIADTNNSRVLKLDRDLNYILSFVEPDDPTYEKGKTFMPEKVVADVKGRAYILARNVNKGFLKYEYDGKFTAFYGASEVTYNFKDLLWKKLSTRAQREQMESFVPTEYSNAYIDSTGFVFAVLKTFSEWDLKSDKAKPIRRLNALGKDILVKNGEYLPIGDLQWGNAAGIKGPARFSDVTVLDNEVYVVVDETRGRIFGYDNQGYLLYAFGGKGNIAGYFRSPSAIEHCGRDLFVLDSQGCSLTVFTPTDLGHLVYDATEQYAVGEYDAAAETWNEVLQLNGTYDLAYVGIGKSFMRQKKYHEAMDAFGLKRDKKDYSKAFQYFRKEWIEANIGWIIAILIVAVVLWLVVKIVKRIKWEMAQL